VGSIVLDDSTALDGTIRYDDDIDIDIAPGGSFVVFVAEGDENRDLVHPGRDPFGVTNPIFFTR
jgi:hypothetical protein